MSRNYEIRSIGFARLKKSLPFQLCVYWGGVASEWLVDNAQWQSGICLHGLCLNAS
jgi:hypothetical protein